MTANLITVKNNGINNNNGNSLRAYKLVNREVK